MQFKGEAYKKDGMWKLKLELEDWIIDDILRDLNERATRTTLLLVDDNPIAGSSYYGNIPTSRYAKLPKVIANVAFEEDSTDGVKQEE